MNPSPNSLGSQNHCALWRWVLRYNGCLGIQRIALAAENAEPYDLSCKSLNFQPEKPKTLDSSGRRYDEGAVASLSTGWLGASGLFPAF